MSRITAPDTGYNAWAISELRSLVANGSTDPKVHELLASYESGNAPAAPVIATVGSGPVITGVKRAGGPVTATEYSYERRGNGGNGNSAHRPAPIMTDAQRGYIVALLDRVPSDVSELARPWFVDHAATMTKLQASDVITRLKKHADAAPVAQPTPAAPVAQRSTQGSAWAEWRKLAGELAELGNSTGARFAIDSATGNNDLDFWAIVKRDGRNGSPVFYLNRVIGGRPDVGVRMSPDAMVAVARRIMAAGPREALERFGRELGQCGRCGRHLTDDESRARGIGPDCWGKL